MKKTLMILAILINLSGCTSMVFKHGILIVDSNDCSKVALSNYINTEESLQFETIDNLNLKSHFSQLAKIDSKGYVLSEFCMMTAGSFNLSTIKEITNFFASEETQLKLSFDKGTSVRALFLFGSNESDFNNQLETIKSSLDDGSKTPAQIIDEWLKTASDDDKAKFFAQTAGAETELKLRYQ